LEAGIPHLRRFLLSSYGEHRLMLMLQAYFDESADRFAYGIGGCVATLENWEKFVPEWLAVIRAFHVRGFHMKSVAHFRDEYVGWKEDRRQAFLNDLLPILDKYATTLVSAAMSSEAFRGLTDEERAGFLNEPYYPCFQECVRGAALEAWGEPPDEKVQIYFARHPSFTGMAGKLYDAMLETSDVRDRLGGISFQSPYELIPLQAADFVAYEWRKKVSDALRGHERLRHPLKVMFRKADTFKLRFIAFHSVESLRSRIYWDDLNSSELGN
jgi:hypothetical protein